MGNVLCRSCCTKKKSALTKKSPRKKFKTPVRKSLAKKTEPAVHIVSPDDESAQIHSSLDDLSTTQRTLRVGVEQQFINDRQCRANTAPRQTNSREPFFTPVKSSSDDDEYSTCCSSTSSSSCISPDSLTSVTASTASTSCRNSSSSGSCCTCSACRKREGLMQDCSPSEHHTSSHSTTTTTVLSSSLSSSRSTATYSISSCSSTSSNYVPRSHPKDVKPMSCQGNHRSRTTEPFATTSSSDTDSATSASSSQNIRSTLPRSSENMVKVPRLPITESCTPQAVVIPFCPSSNIPTVTAEMLATEVAVQNGQSCRHTVDLAALWSHLVSQSISEEEDKLNSGQQELLAAEAQRCRLESPTSYEEQRLTSWESMVLSPCVDPMMLDVLSLDVPKLTLYSDAHQFREEYRNSFYNTDRNSGGGRIEPLCNAGGDARAHCNPSEAQHFDLFATFNGTLSSSNMLLATVTSTTPPRRKTSQQYCRRCPHCSLCCFHVASCLRVNKDGTISCGEKHHHAHNCSTGEGENESRHDTVGDGGEAASVCCNITAGQEWLQQRCCCSSSSSGFPMVPLHSGDDDWISVDAIRQMVSQFAPDWVAVFDAWFLAAISSSCMISALEILTLWVGMDLSCFSVVCRAATTTTGGGSQRRREGHGKETGLVFALKISVAHSQTKVTSDHHRTIIADDDTSLMSQRPTLRLLLEHMLGVPPPPPERGGTDEQHTIIHPSELRSMSEVVEIILCDLWRPRLLSNGSTTRRTSTHVSAQKNGLTPHKTLVLQRRLG